MANSKVPKSVNVCGHDYRVKLVSERRLGKKTAGEMSHPERVIRLLKTLNEEELWLTFLHEVKHAFDAENGDMQVLNHDIQEKSCDQFASFISSLQKQGVL